MSRPARASTPAGYRGSPWAGPRYAPSMPLQRQPGPEGSVRAVQVRVRLGAGLSRLSKAPALTLVLEDGATVDDLLARLRDSEPELAPALRSALPVVGGVHA